jgi:hypothetical protein
VTKAPAYEEEEEEEEEAPVAKKEKKKAKKSSGSHGFFGISVGIDQNPFADVEGGTIPRVGDFSHLDLKLRINDDIMLGILIGLAHSGATTTTVDGTDLPEADDAYTPILIGAQFDYFLPTPLLPTSIGADIIYASLGEVQKVSASALMIDILYSAHAELVKNLILTGKVGIGIEYLMTEDNSGQQKQETSRLDFGVKAGIALSWFII